MVSGRIRCLLAAGVFSFATLGRSAPLNEPLPNDPLELVSGQVRFASRAADRGTAMELLGRAQGNYALAGAGQAYKLNVTFTVNSGGATQYDGVWKMEQTFDPQQGLRWTAESDSGYWINEISGNGQLYAEGTPGPIPLRLQEARAALLDAIPSGSYAARAALRTSSATFHGGEVTCVLIAGARGSLDAPARRWDETEECIDPQTGLLMVHSQVPGRYDAYDYANAPRLGDHVFPRHVTVTEGGKTVSEISVDSLEPLSSVDPSLFVPTPAMKERGRAVAMAGAQKIMRTIPMDPGSSTAATHTVCVFGLLTASGDFVDAHSLEPSDPLSAAAVAAARQIQFAKPALPGELAPPPRQHFVFVIERFVPSR